MAGIILLLGSMTAIGAISGDIYLPAMPAIARDLQCSNALVQVTVAATLLGGAIGQLLIGPISDMLGRRSPAMVGIAIHIVASGAVLFAPNIWVLLALRCLQGIGNASGQVIATSVVRDLYQGSKAARLMSQLVLLIGVAPLFAPTLGSWLSYQFGWRSNFTFLTLIGLALEIAMAVKLEDTLAPESRAHGRLTSVFSSFKVLARDRRFLALAAIPGLGQSVMMTWVSSSSFLLLEHYKVSTWAYPLLFACGGICSVAGAQLNAHLVKLRSPAIPLRAATPLSFLFSLVALVLALTHTGGLFGLLLPLWAIIFCDGMVMANATALAMTRHGEIAGAAAALIGTAQTLSTGVVVTIVSFVGGTQIVMTTVIACCLGLIMAILLGGTTVYRRRFPQDASGPHPKN